MAGQEKAKQLFREETNVLFSGPDDLVEKTLTEKNFVVRLNEIFTFCGHKFSRVAIFLKFG